MRTAAPTAQVRAAGRDHRFHPLRIARIVRETADTRSFVLEVPPELQSAFAYEAGQFCTFRAWIEGRPYLRCYSMSSSPAVDDELQVTVKRVPGGVVSNWMNDALAPGDVIETSCPAGVFCPSPSDDDLAAFSAGSGITPVLSIVKTTLATTSRRVRLLYANRDRDAIIFAPDLDRLVEQYPGRLEVVHHLDVEHGFVDADAVGALATIAADVEYFICGPEPFMDIVESTLLGFDVDAWRVHIERFTPAEPTPLMEAPNGAPTSSSVTIEHDGRSDTVDHRPGTTVLQTARQMGMAPPFSCESGSCATCMAKVVEGDVTMYVNNALTDDEIAEGWVLTCQAVPATPSVHVVYEDG
jgi:3-ketosteroid 9alpha-monooxygenase subunit B